MKSEEFTITRSNRHWARCAALGALILAGCGSVELPETCHYRLAMPTSMSPAPAAEVARPARDLPRLAVGELQLAAELSGERLGVADGPVQVRFHKFHVWAASLDRLLNDALVRGLATSGRFADVLDGSSRQRADLTLDGRVHGFHLEVGADGWFGRMDCELRLTVTDTGELVFRREFTSVRRASEPNAEAGVIALSMAVADVIEQFVAAYDSREIVGSLPESR